MTKTTTVRKTDKKTRGDAKHEDMYEVILYNDEHSIAELVVMSLQRVFGHDMQLALKIMMDAHTNGRAIAEVEAQSEAILHKQQLESSGLTVEVDKV